MTRSRPLLLLLGAAVPALLACDEEGGETVTNPGQPTFFQVQVENVSQAYDFLASGVFDTPEGAGMPGPLTPGGTYRFEFDGGPGHRISFATMFVPSNDYFYAPGPGGIALFDADGMAVSGDVTDEIMLWDAGTEVNQEPGLGADQPMRQADLDTGDPDPDETVRLAEDTHGNLPPVSEVVQVTLEHLGGTRFALEIENVSDGGTLMTSDMNTQAVPLAPGVFTVHADDAPLFETGAEDRGEGLEALAEDGIAGPLGDVLADRTGLTSPLAPGVWVTHGSAGILFEDGATDRGEGLEALAEDGVPSQLDQFLASLVSGPRVTAEGVFDTPEGAEGPGPLMPGSAYVFTVRAFPGDRLSLATMLVQSNDLFYAPDPDGIDLFDASGQPVSGDMTGAIALWDAGTEVNQFPGAGLDQAPRQAGPDTGPNEGATIGLVDDGFTYPEVDEVIRVTITPSGS